MRYFRENVFNTVAKIDGVYTEARLLYNGDHDQCMDRMVQRSVSSTVYMHLSSFAALQIVVNFDQRLWDQFPWLRNLPAREAYHYILAGPL